MHPGVPAQLRTLPLRPLQACFPYAAAVLKESMRIYPPSITLMREAPGSGPWQLGGYAVPPGTALQVQDGAEPANYRLGGQLRRCHC